MKIHPTAIVEDGATIGADVEIGPYAHIGKDVKLGDGTVVKQGAIIDGHTTIGSMCQIFPYACIGMKTQDLKYKDGSVSYVEIGDRTVIREFATVHLGTADGEKTIIGSDCLFMCYCHAAHGVILGNHCICSNSVQLAGDVHLNDWAIVGGCAAAHQFCTVGKHAMVGGMVKLNLVKDRVGARVDTYEFMPTVTQKEPYTTNMCAYKLSDYTDELAARSTVSSWAGEGGTLGWYLDYCSMVLGDAFDWDTRSVHGTL